MPWAGQNEVDWKDSNLPNSFVLLQQHRKVLDKGKPDDIMPSVKGTKVSEHVRLL